MAGSFKNGIFVLLFAFFVGIAFFALPYFYAEGAGQAALFLNPASGTFLVGSTFDVSVVLDTKGIAVNTIEVELSFPSDKLQVASPSVGKSIIQLWPAPPVFSNREGKIYFVGGIPSPGIVTSQGVVLTLTFRVVSPGEAEIKFGEKTSVLANDGRGTDILGQKPSVFYRFSVPPPQGPTISSPTHPDQERWYRDPNPLFVWSRSSFADGYSFTLDRDPSGFPDTSVEGQTPTASFENVENGISYFHLRERAGGVWGGVSHYTVKIDNDPPAAFQVNVSPSRRTTNRNPIFRFFTTDALSGFDHFEMKLVPLSGSQVSDSLFFEVASPYQAVRMDAGRYQIIMRALDRAGNTRDEAVPLNIVSSLTQFWGPEGLDLVFVFIPWFRLLLILLLLLVIAAVLLVLFWTHHRHHLLQALREDVRKFFGSSNHFPGGGVLVLFLLLGGMLFFSTVVGAAGVPGVPTINIAPSQYYPLDELLYLEGKASPNAGLDILFENIAGGAQPVRVSVNTNAGGEWFFSERLELASGEWSVRVRSAKENEYSDWSNPRIIRSVVSGFFVGGIKIKYLPIAVFLTASIAASVYLLWYSAKRVRSIEHVRLEEDMKHREAEMKETLRAHERIAVTQAVERSFGDLRKRVVDELDHLEVKARRNGALSEEEEKHREELLHELREAEELVEKELKTIF
ncbi:MAG: cohesin domain-containing protein [bacterium]|nr:cohesin domain-containing protein [bacterium]